MNKKSKKPPPLPLILPNSGPGLAAGGPVAGQGPPGQPMALDAPVPMDHDGCATTPDLFVPAFVDLVRTVAPT